MTSSLLVRICFDSSLRNLLLGRDYFDKFIDKKTAIQTSNLLYRSKGTDYSIQQFFRVFFGFDVDIRYGRDEVFEVGDPRLETLEYVGEVKDGNLFPGSRVRFTYDDGDTEVWAGRQLPEVSFIEAIYVNEDYMEFDNDADPDNNYAEEVERVEKYNIFRQLRQDIDYTIDYDTRSVDFLVTDDPVDADDPWISYLAANAEIAEDMPLRVITKRNFPSGSFLGAERSDKKIMDNGYYQLYSLLIRTPISVKKWREAYKDFVHPGGMYLGAEVAIEEDVPVLSATQPNTIIGIEAIDVSAIAEIEQRVALTLTELNIVERDTGKTVGYTQSGFVTNDRTPYSDVDSGGIDSAGAPVYAEERFDSDGAPEVYRSRINDPKNLSARGFTMEDLATQYQRMDRIDDIEARTWDNVEADFSNTINTIDENRWLGTTGNILCLDSDGNAQNILGPVLDFAAEVPGCPGYHFNLFAAFDGPGGEGGPLQGYSSTGENFHLVDGVASRKYTAYRDERVWGTTVGNNFSDPFNADSSIGFPGDADFANPFQYSIVNGVASNVILYFLSGYLVDSGGIGPGDSEDYMGAFIKFDDSFGVQQLIQLPDSA